MRFTCVVADSFGACTEWTLEPVGPADLYRSSAKRPTSATDVKTDRGAEVRFSATLRR